MIDIFILKTLEPISTLSSNRMQELATLCFSEKVSKGMDPFRMNVAKNAQAVYLLKGRLGLHFKQGGNTVIDANSADAKHPIDSTKLELNDSIALSEIEIVRIDLDLLDIMMTWDQLATMRTNEQHNVLMSSEQKYDFNQWLSESSAFNITKLQSGVFGRLPSANIEEMFRRMQIVNVNAGQVLIRQGAIGDYYYLIDSGIAVVSRVDHAGNIEIVSELTAGDSFAEDALISESKRNATVSMKTEGKILRLNKIDFIELLKSPLIKQVNMNDAINMASCGAIWIDVRSPSEYKSFHIAGAINLPLTQLRSLIHSLDKGNDYIVYCQTGRRSSVAAFILINNGFNAAILQRDG